LLQKTRFLAGFLAILATSLAFASTNEEPKHIAGVFIGYTNAESETEFSYGVEYEYKFSRRWGAGVGYEKTNNAHHGAGVDVALVSLYLHPWKALRVGLGVGKETVGSYTDYSDSLHPHRHSRHSENLVRTSLSYDFHVGGFGIAPTLAVDFVDGETATVFGFAVVKAF
jgi:hypothetical protein|tara:strand:- start:63 stop:569 length:507 start_codon:yes stop_codon:yes gene_type:complete